jgi:hypothetical protein
MIDKRSYRISITVKAIAGVVKIVDVSLSSTPVD